MTMKNAESRARMQDGVSRPRGRRQQRSDAETRRLIIGAATRIFLASGFRGTNMEAVAQAAGVSKKTIYRLVPTKEDLFGAVISMRSEAVNRQISDDSSHGAAEAQRTLRRYLLDLGLLVLSEETVALNRLIYAEAQQFPAMVHSYYAAGPQRGLDNLTVWLEARRREGVFRLDDAREAAEMLMAMVIGEPLRVAVLGIAAAPDSAAIARRVDRAVGIFLRGCLVQPGAA